jgi:hypothetical protein
VIDLIKELISKKAKRGFLGNKITLTCPVCNLSEKSTYYDLLKKQQFEIQKSIAVPEHYIRESYYEEEIMATPIKFMKQCPKCSGQMETYSPVALEYILNILQSPSTDDVMYG